MIPTRIIDAVLSLEPCEPKVLRAALEATKSIDAAIKATHTADLEWLAHEVDSETMAQARAVRDDAVAKLRRARASALTAYADAAASVAHDYGAASAVLALVAYGEVECAVSTTYRATLVKIVVSWAARIGGEDAS